MIGRILARGHFWARTVNFFHLIAEKNRSRISKAIEEGKNTTEMISDPTLQALYDANQFIRQEEEANRNHGEQQQQITGRQLSDRLYHLLLKNVSKDDPLTQDELQELREFRAELSNDQWKEWLKFARNERKRLQHHHQQQESPSPELKIPQSRLAQQQTTDNNEGLTSGRRPSSASSSSTNIPFIQAEDNNNNSSSNLAGGIASLSRRLSFNKRDPTSSLSAALTLPEMNSQPTLSTLTAATLHGNDDDEEREPQIPKEDLRELVIRRESLRNPSSSSILPQQPQQLEQQQLQQRNPPVLPSQEEELKSLIRKESLRLLKQQNSEAPVNPSSSSSSSRRPTVNAHLVSSQSQLQQLAQPPQQQEDDEEFKNMENLANKFHSNQIRKRSILQPSSSSLAPSSIQQPNNFFTNRIIPDESQIQYHPSLDHYNQQQQHHVPSQEEILRQYQEDIQHPHISNSRYPVEEEEGDHDDENQYHHYQQPHQERSSRNNRKQQDEEDEDYPDDFHEEQQQQYQQRQQQLLKDDEPQIEKRLMNPIYTPYSRPVYQTSDLPEVEDEQESQHESSEEKERNDLFFNKHQPRLPHQTPQIFDQRMNFPLESNYTSTPSYREEIVNPFTEKETKVDTNRKQRPISTLMTSLDSGVSLEKKSLSRSMSTTSSTSVAPSPLTMKNDIYGRMNSTSFHPNVRPSQIIPYQSVQPTITPNTQTVPYQPNIQRKAIPVETTNLFTSTEPQIPTVRDTIPGKSKEIPSAEEKDLPMSKEEGVYVTKADLDKLKEQILLSLKEEQAETEKRRISKEQKTLQVQLEDNVTNADLGKRRIDTASTTTKAVINSLSHVQQSGKLHPYQNDG